MLESSHVVAFAAATDLHRARVDGYPHWPGW